MCRQGDEHRGVETLLSGHVDKVNAVRFFPSGLKDIGIVLSGSVDQTVRVWRFATDLSRGYENVAVLEGHTGSVNCLAVLAGSNVVASGAADATIRIWSLSTSDISVVVKALQNIHICPRFFPLALALENLGTDGALILAVGGTNNLVQIYTTEKSQGRSTFSFQAHLSGHEGWIRSLDFVKADCSGSNDLLLASASQDRYIRLWRVHEGREFPIVTSVQDPSQGTPSKLLSNKDHRFEAAGVPYSLTFEALLLGHEDWIYTISWKLSMDRLQLLSASADNSLAIWEADTRSSIWICTTRLGEISAQKGSTTATGSTGGFWIGLWSPDGASVTSLGRTGSWRLWKWDRVGNRWLQELGISGHIKNVRGISWAKDGAYLLSTSSDQTTRLHAEWKRKITRSWHEFARPQIHGYDLNCVDTFGQSQFISGADEKLIRVFDEPRAVADILERLCGISASHRQMPDAANIPVLGLSNKAIELFDEEGLDVDAEPHDREAPNLPDVAYVVRKPNLSSKHPPLEDNLAIQTLWPEREKLYGHGYEISTLAASHDGSVAATACKASSTEHAVIRLYGTREWREVGAAMLVHSLTITCLRFSDDDKFLLSVGRDRQLAVFVRDDNSLAYTLQCHNTKAHSRMILGAAWAPLWVGRSFATAGRDKYVKLWGFQGSDLRCKGTISASSSVTSIDFSPVRVGTMLLLALGTETGGLSLYSLDASTLSMQASHTIDSR